MQKTGCVSVFPEGLASGREYAHKEIFKIFVTFFENHYNILLLAQ